MCDRCNGAFAFFGLAEPQAAMLEAYAAALATGWSPDNTRDVSTEHRAAIAADPTAFLDDLLRQDGTIRLSDGSMMPRLPFRHRWMWDGDFCGVISLRWQPGSNDLPLHVPGHIGYAVVPWKRNHGYATRALRHILEEAREVGLDRVSLTVEAENTPSITAIDRNGGVRVGTWRHPAYSGGRDYDLYVINF